MDPLRLGIMGGTFDPIHIGHLIAASEVASAIQLDRVLFVPAGRPWQKSLYSDGEDRLLMTTLAIAGDRRFAVSRIELDRGGPTYSVDTVAALRDFYGPETELFFILGADAATGLSTWHNVDDLVASTHIVVVSRSGNEGLPDLVDADLSEVAMPLVDVSSTDICERVRRGRSIAYMVPPAVENYIRANGLYVTEDEVAHA
ncbi:MAG: nicotinate-nucleotide adenylyltransferase [Actinomycetota bacterium]|nr:nicotinate-nucleotide adenylyltransferase [Actinomycetota bacterium]